LTAIPEKGFQFKLMQFEMRECLAHKAPFHISGLSLIAAD
jgi:hypothetical protein